MVPTKIGSDLSVDTGPLNQNPKSASLKFLSFKNVAQNDNMLREKQTLQIQNPFVMTGFAYTLSK